MHQNFFFLFLKLPRRKRNTTKLASLICNRFSFFLSFLFRRLFFLSFFLSFLLLFELMPMHARLFCVGQCALVLPSVKMKGRLGRLNAQSAVRMAPLGLPKSTWRPASSRCAGSSGKPLSPIGNSPGLTVKADDGFVLAGRSLAVISISVCRLLAYSCVRLPACLPAPACLSAGLSVYLSACLSVCPAEGLQVRLSVGLSFCLLV